MLEAERVTVLRRIENAGRATRSTVHARKRLDALAGYLDALTIRDVDRDVLDVLNRLPVLATCHSLDALHLATAMLFQQHLSQPLRLCTLDERMRAAGEALKLIVVPE